MSRGRIRSKLTRALTSAWRWLRTATGDDAYEKYVEHHMSRHPDKPLATRTEFFDERLKHKWSGVSRCC